MERFTQLGERVDYAQALQWGIGNWRRDHGVPCYNVHPGMPIWVMHEMGDVGRQYMARVTWGYRPTWAERKGYPAVPVTCGETAPRKRYYRGLWDNRRRCLVPMDGWYEWVPQADPSLDPLPHYIARRDGQPMFAAALTSLDPADLDRPAGVVILAHGSGVLGRPDLAPLILHEAAAKKWLSHANNYDGYGALDCPLPGDLAWHRVTSRVIDISNNGPELIRPIRERAPS
ncbi:SOS response-associated peptidase [Chitiniphilus eburneus]|uniref:SOS response-associated peptidase n=1 Tax=Chitiniphilus eburneus TaxID=2571148 RepID=UPI0035D07AD0